MTHASIVVAIALVTLVGVLRALFGTAPRILADLGLVAAALHYAQLAAAHTSSFTALTLTGLVAATAVLVRPPADARRRPRFPVLLTLATVLGIWFGLTAPHVSPVSPPPATTPTAPTPTP